MSDPELRRAANVGVGPVMIDFFADADYRELCNEKRIQAVLLGMKDPGCAARDAATMRWLR